MRIPRKEETMWRKFDLETSPVNAGDLSVQKVRIEGYLDSSTFPRLQEHLNGLIAEGHYHYLLDFSELDYISSAGLGVLIGMLREVRDKGGDLKIMHMSDKIQRIFNLLGFSKLLKVYPDEETALASFDGGEKEDTEEAAEY
jgi:anti-sigma B factor antagonist